MNLDQLLAALTIEDSRDYAVQQNPTMWIQVAFLDPNGLPRTYANCDAVEGRLDAMNAREYHAAYPEA